MHVLAADVDDKVPCAQSKQFEPPEAAEYVPAKQLEQLDVLELA